MEGDVLNPKNMFFKQLFVEAIGALKEPFRLIADEFDARPLEPDDVNFARYLLTGAAPLIEEIRKTANRMGLDPDETETIIQLHLIGPATCNAKQFDGIDEPTY